ncbi:MAG: GntR family transcriptional regulator [Lachnospiraceae bacterium]|nr:GntR family transcriptional regulator [Lachnospiraceae bacterium]
MIFNIDFHSDEALYTQLCNQIIIGIAKETVHEGDSLPSVRQLAEEVGINMHTVNKAYTVLKQEGFVKVDRRRGVIIAVNTDKLRAIAETKENLRILLARASCMNISREEIHALIDEIYREYE